MVRVHAALFRVAPTRDNKIRKGEMIMASEKDIENLMKMLDGKVKAGTSRINVTATDAFADGEIKEVHHHGRCDVGSAWAKGTVKNPECIDIPTEIEPED